MDFLKQIPISVNKTSMMLPLQKHLKNRPIQSIVAQSCEITDENALKFMVVVDYYMETNKLYDRIKRHPKLMEQLLKFKSYGTFLFYNCKVKQEIGQSLLKCMSCNLVGSYENILTHMIINHNTHLSHTQCAYCKRTDLDTHFKNGSFQECYSNYLKKEDINVSNNIKVQIIEKFYETLREISEFLGVAILRVENYAGIGYKKSEFIDDPDFSPKCIVYKNKGSKKTMDPTKLDKLVQNALEKIYGNNKQVLFYGDKHLDESEVYVIDDSDDENDEKDGNRQRSPMMAWPVSVKREIVDHTYNKPSSSSQQLTVGHNARDKSIQNASVSNSNHANSSTMAANGNKGKNAEHSCVVDKFDASRVVDDAENFGKYVTSRLLILPDTNKRRRLEFHIQEAILKFERAEIERNM